MTWKFTIKNFAPIALLLTLSGCLTQSETPSGINETPDYLLPALVKGKYHNIKNTDVFVLDEQAHFLTRQGPTLKTLLH